MSKPQRKNAKHKNENWKYKNRSYFNIFINSITYIYNTKLKNNTKTFD